ncbi:MAG TPA: hypothetical protein DCZ11_11630 [Gammaproteobacteria bacterium]|nr:hypothetical protein [Gammaproteobacteria bacterium]MCH79079.1 hypothetical protein [Gammaproteobacteria bacterium]
MSLTMILVIGVIVLVVFFAILAGATLLSLGEKHKSGHLPHDARSEASSSTPRRRKGSAQGGSKKRRKR